jgi:hypothetical protein
VQGRARVDRELLDAEAVAGDLVPAGSVLGFVARPAAEILQSETA